MFKVGDLVEIVGMPVNVAPFPDYKVLIGFVGEVVSVYQHADTEQVKVKAKVTTGLNLLNALWYDSFCVKVPALEKIVEYKLGLNYETTPKTKSKAVRC